MERLIHGEDPEADIIAKLDESARLLRPEEHEQMWRFDVSFGNDFADPAFEAWQEGDIRRATDLLLASIGWLPPEGYMPRVERRVNFIQSQQELAATGGSLSRIVLVDKLEDAVTPGTGLSFRTQLVWPLLFIPPENVTILPRSACDEVDIELPDYDVNWYGSRRMMLTTYEDGCEHIRAFYDAQEPEDAGCIECGSSFRSGIDILIRQGLGRRLGSIDIHRPPQSIEDMLNRRMA